MVLDTVPVVRSKRAATAAHDFCPSSDTIVVFLWRCKRAWALFGPYPLQSAVVPIYLGEPGVCEFLFLWRHLQPQMANALQI